MMTAITEWIKKHILEWIKDYPKYVLPFGLFSAFCLFLPDTALKSIGILDLRNQFKPYLGATLILSITFILSAGIYWFTEWTRLKYFNFISKRRITTRLGRLSKEEADILRLYIEKQTYTQSLSTMNGIVNNLASLGIIFQSSRHTRAFDLSVDFNIKPWIWDYLYSHPELLIHKAPKGQ